MSIAFPVVASRPSDIEVRAVLLTAEVAKDHAAATGALGVGDQASVAAVLAGAGFEGKPGEAVLMASPDGVPVVALGLGALDDLDGQAARRAGAAFARTAKRFTTAAVDFSTLSGRSELDTLAAAWVEGATLAAYRYRAYKAKVDTANLATVSLVHSGAEDERAKLEAATQVAQSVAEAVCWARDLVNEPGGSMTPTALAEAAAAMAKREGLEVTVLDAKVIEKEKLGGLMGVNRGSAQEPRFVKISYTPKGEAKGKVALVGKGITFDSGGLSLKTGEGMMTMKCDMGGAAAVFGTMAAISAVAPSVAVTGYTPLTDNMTGGDATRPGDVLTMRGGKTVEVLNTDAEGRLVLADALVMASEDKPDAIVDLATLTGACVVALGTGIAGLMGRNDSWLSQVEAASKRTGERVWRLPLPADYRASLDTPVADLKNISGGRDAGTLTAGLFLQEFVGDGIPWAHIDIAGTGWAGKDSHEYTTGGTGFGIRLVLDLLANFERPTS